MSFTSRITNLAAGAGGGVGSAILTDITPSSGNISLKSFDADSSTAYFCGTIGSYYNGSNAFYSIFLGKVNLSTGAVSDTYYDDQSATGAWFIDAEHAVLSGNNLICTGEQGAYYQGYSVYSKATNYSFVYNAGWKSSTSFTFCSALNKATPDYLFTCGTDLFSGDYRATVTKKDIDNNYTPWSTSLTLTAGVNDRASSVACANAQDDAFAVLQMGGNKHPGLWKINEYGGTTWSRRIFPDSTNLMDTSGNITTPPNAIIMDSSDNAYVAFNLKMNTNVSTNGRTGTYIYKMNTNGALQWAKLMYRSDGDHTVNVTSVEEDSSGNILLGGYVRDHTPTQQTYDMFVARMNTSGTLTEFKTFRTTNTQSTSTAVFYPSRVRELSNGNIGALVTHNIGTTSNNRSFFNCTSDMEGDFGDILVQDYLSNITVTSDTSATASAAGTTTSLGSPTMTNFTNNLTSTSVSSSVSTYG